MGCIYMRTSPSGKVYIGQTSFTEERRWKEHCFLAFYVKSKDYNTPLSRAIRKYGADSFTCTILEDGIFDHETLLNRERYWITYYDSYKKGLNATMGGDGYRTIDTNKVKSLWDEGHCVRDICLLLNIDSATALKHLNMTAVECEKRGPVYKTKNSIKYFGDYKTGKNIPVSCFSLETGEHVKSFRSFYEAAKFVKSKFSSSIIRATKGVYSSAFGYYWRIGEDKTPISIDVLKKIKHRKKPEKRYVVCINENKMYSDSRCAEKYTGICYKSILEACKGNQRTAGGFCWRYATTEDMKTLLLIKTEKPHKLAHNARKVICIETGKTYDSLKLAGQDVGVCSSMIYNCCKGRTNTAAGYRWKYV